MAIPLVRRGAIEARTLHSLAQSLDKFRQCNVAKKANNVIRPPQFEIPIDQARFLSVPIPVCYLIRTFLYRTILFAIFFSSRNKKKLFIQYSVFMYRL